MEQVFIFTANFTARAFYMGAAIADCFYMETDACLLRVCVCVCVCGWVDGWMSGYVSRA